MLPPGQSVEGTKGIRNLRHQREPESPTISPNGHIIIYSTKKDEQGYLAGITVDKKSKFQLPVKLGSIREPAWSPFLN